MNKKDIQKAMKKSMDIMKEWGYENWAEEETEESPESVLLWILVYKVLEIEKILIELQGGINKCHIK